jgi:RNA polymerase sigma-70 factor (ECF subfamily)
MKAEMSHAADKNLVELAKNGDLEAYAELVRRYRERIYRTICLFTHDHNDADDLAQETFLQGFKALRHFNQKSQFYTWIFRIAVNLSLNFMKKKKRETKWEGDMERLPDPGQESASSPESASSGRELGVRLREAIDSLPLIYRAAFNLVVFQEMSHGEAARVLGCSENTVSWRMHKARKMLQTKMRPYLGEVKHEM